jgi:hypothetical protein
MSAAKNEEIAIFFDLKEVGHSMQEMALDVVKSTDENIISRWYHSQKKADLYVWSDNHSNIIRSQFHLHGQIVEWNILEGVRTGLVVENEQENETTQEEIQFDSAPQKTAVMQVVNILSAMSVLRVEDREILIYNLKHSPKASEMDPDDFVRTYGRGRMKKLTRLQKIAKYIRFVFSRK